MLAAELPVVRVYTNVEGTKVTYRHVTEEIADAYLNAEREALQERHEVP